jgi:hypothetical protein
MNLLCPVWTGSQYLHLDLHASHDLLVTIPDQTLKKVQAVRNIKAGFYTMVLEWVQIMTSSYIIEQQLDVQWYDYPLHSKVHNVMSIYNMAALPVFFSLTVQL